MTQVIRDMARDERPRERMIMHGAQTLSNAELLALFIGCGKPGKNALDIARELLSEGMTRLARRELTALAKVPGIGVAKAARILAAFEFARRVASGEPEEPPDFDHYSIGAKLVKDYGRMNQERLGAIVLDARHRVLKQRELFIGTINNALVSTGDILRFVLLENGCAVVVYHNHPSGTCVPSAEDESFTDKLRYSLSTADIELVDHLIIGAHGYFSMKQKGLL
jgi:DNA repair protein RadC